MKLKTRILLNVFTASFAATLLQRGIYFFTHAVLGFSQAQNLWLALVVGITYVMGASASHRVSARFGERRTLVSVVALLALVSAGLTCIADTRVVCVSVPLLALLQGAAWPILESYMSAGETPEGLGRVLSRYNIAWALSVAPALAVAGPVIASGTPRLLFALAATLNVLVGASCLAFPTEPTHLDSAHPARPDPLVLARFRGLLVAARFAMLCSYLLMYVLAPLMPEIMRGVGFETASAARASGLIDIARLTCFVGLFAYSGWRGKKLPLWLAIVALPLGFLLVLFGPHVLAVVSGELLFGLAAGFLYTAALYYAQLVQNASVDAGGAHEALIGAGYALGPVAGLIGTALAQGAAPGTTAYIRGMSTATLPFILACSLFAAWPLLKPKRINPQANA